MNVEYKLAFKSRRLALNLKYKNYIPLIFVLILLINCSGTRPSLIGKFSTCPDKPNCVSSKSLVGSHKIAPIIYKGTSQDAREKILGIIKSMPRAKISSDGDNFIHVEFTSRIFRFVDDVEFYFDELGIIHFRSASRIGHSDMGVNRERMEEIRRSFMGKG